MKKTTARTIRLSPSKHQIEEAWTPELVSGGWTAISNYFLENYASLTPAITTPEAMLIIHLMRHKWDKEPPYPTFKTLATRMGMKPPAVRTHARRLERKGYLKRTVQVAMPNLFHLEPLFDALEQHKTNRTTEDSPTKVQQ